MTRNQSIDLVKIIAMIMVVRMHIGLNHNLEHFAPFSFIHGIISPAVPLFFMVSGYLMQSKMPDYKYVWRKILGILKYVYIIIPIACVFTGIFEHHPRPHSLYLWIIGGGNLWQFWYFAAIILVYVCAPIVCKWITTTKANIIIACDALLCTTVVILNVYYQFEEKYVIATFRIWTWLLYFMIGAYIKQYGCNKNINWLWVLVMVGNAAIFINRSLTPKFDYLYGSAICAAYAYCIFCACINTKLSDSKIIKELSALFLPVYTLHPFAIQLYGKYLHIDCFQQFSGTICFMIVLIATFGISWLLMRIPYVKNIFRI